MSSGRRSPAERTGHTRRCRAFQWRNEAACHGFWRAGALRKLSGRMNAHPLLRWRFPVGQGRPPGDLAAGSAHRRCHARERNLFRPFRLCRQGRDLRRPFPVRDDAAVGRMGGGTCSASAGCGICARRNPASRAPMRARWSMNGFRCRAAGTRYGWRPEVLSRRIISWLSQAPLILADADVYFYRRFLRSLTRQVRYLRHTRCGIARRRAAACRR